MKWFSGWFGCKGPFVCEWATHRLYLPYCFFTATNTAIFKLELNCKFTFDVIKSTSDAFPTGVELLQLAKNMFLLIANVEVKIT